MDPHPSFEALIEEQIHKWQIEQGKKYKNPLRPVITLSRLPGAYGGQIAKKLSEDLNIDLFDQEIVEKISQNAHISKRIVETLDDQDRSIFDEWIAALGEDHMWSYEYLQQLTSVIAAIGAHGYAVIVGRGAGFMLPKTVCLRVLITAPLEKRVRNIMKLFSVSEAEARRNVMKVESERRAFIRQYFHADLTDPANYDVVINTENIDVDAATATVRELFNARNWYHFNFSEE
jgi:cytidylate kinase